MHPLNCRTLSLAWPHLRPPKPTLGAMCELFRLDKNEDQNNLEKYQNDPAGFAHGIQYCVRSALFALVPPPWFALKPHGHMKQLEGFTWVTFKNLAGPLRSGRRPGTKMMAQLSIETGTEPN